MPRILVVDDDPLARAVTADAIRSAGHEVRAGGRDGGDGVDAAVIHVRTPASLDGVTLRAGLPLVLLAEGGVDAERIAWGRGWRASAVLSRAPPPLLLQRVLQRLVPVDLPVEDAPTLAGEDYLLSAAGPQERFPLIRLLYVAHRVEANGAVLLDEPLGQVSIVVRSGRIVHVRGVPRLLAAVAPGLPDHADLAADLAAAVAAGRPIDLALRGAVAAVGEFCATLVGARGGNVRWDPSVRPPPGAFALPEPTSHVLTAGLRIVRTDERIEALWGRLSWAELALNAPDDAPSSRWGLDAAALRVMRVAANPQSLRGLIERAGGTDAVRRREVLRAVDQLYILGFLRVTPDSEPLARTERAGPLVVDQKLLAELQATLASFEGRHPAEVLGLMKHAVLTHDAVSAAFRELSRRFHPDALHGAATEVRLVAASCFQLLADAHDALSTPAGIAEATRFIDARAKGIPYVAEGERQRAKTAFRRGEGLFRARSWSEADPLLEEAYTLDPLTWPYALYSAQSGYLTRRLDGEAALKRLGAHAGDTPVRQAEVLVARAAIARLEGRAEEALKLCRAALKKDPDNRDAQREVRLHERRNPVVAPSPGLFGGLFQRKKAEKPTSEEEG